MVDVVHCNLANRTSPAPSPCPSPALLPCLPPPPCPLCPVAMVAHRISSSRRVQLTRPGSREFPDLAKRRGNVGDRRGAGGEGEKRFQGAVQGRGRQGKVQGGAASRRKLLILTHGACGCQNWDGGFRGSCHVGLVVFLLGDHGLVVLWRASTSRRAGTEQQSRETRGAKKREEPLHSPLSLTRSLTEQAEPTPTPSPNQPGSSHLHMSIGMSGFHPHSRSGTCHGDGRRLPSWKPTPETKFQRTSFHLPSAKSGIELVSSLSPCRVGPQQSQFLVGLGLVRNIRGTWHAAPAAALFSACSRLGIFCFGRFDTGTAAALPCTRLCLCLCPPGPLHSWTSAEICWFD